MYYAFLLYTVITRLCNVWQIDNCQHYVTVTCHVVLSFELRNFFWLLRFLVKYFSLPITSYYFLLISCISCYECINAGTCLINNLLRFRLLIEFINCGHTVIDCNWLWRMPVDLTFIVHFLCSRGPLKLCMVSHTFVCLHLTYSTTQSITRYVTVSYTHLTLPTNREV